MTNLKLIALVFGAAGICSLWAEAKEDFSAWEPEIARFEAVDVQNPPPQGSILFVGSSSARLWNLAKYFPELTTINRGFGGSEIADSTHFAERIILKHAPRIVVLYAGDNDIAVGKSAETVHADFQEFVAKVHEGLPDTKILYIAIKPSIARWQFAKTYRQANRRIAADCEKDDLLEFIDVWNAMLAGEPGPPSADLFIDDGLHMTHKGYKLWTSLVMPHLE